MLGWWLVSRLVTLSAFVVCDALGPRGRLGGQFYGSPLALAGAWDGTWYRRVAEHGYLLVPGLQSDPAFFPLYPILLDGLHALHIPYSVGGVVISNLAFVVAGPVAFYELGVRVVGEAMARRAACFLVLAPMGFVFSMAYPESLALALIALALLAAFGDRWLLAAGADGGRGTRQAGVRVLLDPGRGDRLVAPFPARARRRRGHAIAACLAAPVGVATYPLYLGWALGDPGAWGAAQTHWGRAFRPAGPIEMVRHLPSALDHQPWLTRDLVLLIVYALLLVAARRAGVGLTWIAAGALILALPLFSGSVMSEGRFGLLAVPIYWGVAALTRRPWVERAARAGCLALLVAGVLVLPYFWP